MTITNKHLADAAQAIAASNPVEDKGPKYIVKHEGPNRKQRRAQYSLYRRGKLKDVQHKA